MQPATPDTHKSWVSCVLPSPATSPPQLQGEGLRMRRGNLERAPPNKCTAKEHGMITNVTETEDDDKAKGL